MAPERFDKSAMSKSVVGVAAAVVVALLGIWFYWRAPHDTAVVKAPQSVPEPSVAAAPETRIEHPVPAAGVAASSAPLPELNESDAAIAAALGAAAGDAPLARYLVPDSIIRHIVVTVDNLPRQKLAVDKRPVIPASGAFMAEGDELHATLDSRNFQRYQTLVDLIRKADMQRFAGVYLRFYPLFQQSYQDLGYPTGYFNDRLVKVIDLLLATPQIAEPIELVRPNVMYVYADPALESLPAGQKLMIRMGPDNAATVKAKLMELRAIITAAAPKH